MQSANSTHDRYGFLDEMRGIAAMAVLIFHIGTRTGAPPLAANGYLAVDFFFMLSGFVIAEAYRARLLNGMTFGDFATKRIIRVAPIIVLGILMGAAYLLARWIAAPARSDSLQDILASAALNLLLLPKWWQASATGWELFPANGPLWSLFFEILVNFAWAGFLVARRRGTLLVLAAISLIALTRLAGIHGTMDMGWNLPTFTGGLARVSFGFLIGLLIHAYRQALPKAGAWASYVAALLLILSLCLPINDVRWTLFVTAVILPCTLVLAVIAGHRTVIPGGRFLGAVSYPVYGLHVPILALYSGGFERFTGLEHTGWEAYLLIPVIVGFAWLITTRYEGAARNILQEHIARRTRAQPVTGA